MTSFHADRLLETLGWVLLHSLWQFALLGGLALAGERLLRRQGVALRTTLLLVVFSGFLVLPLATGWRIQRAPSRADGGLPVQPSIGQASSVDVGSSPVVPPEIRNGDLAPRGGEDSRGVQAIEPLGPWLARWRTEAARLCRPWLGTLVALWGVGICLFGLRPVLGLGVVRRLRNDSQVPGDPRIGESLARLARRLGVTRGVSVLESAVVQTPLVIGWLRPVILLPVSLLTELPAVQLDALLAHELAHIRRHDGIVNLAQLVVETLFFYHPAVWWVSRRIRDVRELCCDDLVVGVMGDRVAYGRALLAVEERRGIAPLLALGARNGSVLQRIERLSRTGAGGALPGWTGVTVTSTGLLLLALVAGSAWSEESPADGESARPESREAAASESPEGEPVQPPRSLDIIIAEQVILWDGEVVEWDVVIDRLRDRRRKQGAPIHPNFYFTLGAHNAKLWQEYHDAAMFHYRELFEPAGVSFGSISPRASPRYDAITGQDDLAPRPELRRQGVVLDPSGKPVVGATVLLFPEKGTMPVVLNSDLSLRDALDEVWTTTDREGRFQLEAPAEGHRIAVLSAAGFALADVPPMGETPRIRLSKLSRLSLAGAADANQKVGLTIHLASLPVDATSFQMYEVELRDKPQTLDLPAGEVTVSRSFATGEGGSVSVPAETLRLAPGSRKLLRIPVKTLKEVLPPGFPGAAPREE